MSGKLRRLVGALLCAAQLFSLPAFGAEPDAAAKAEAAKRFDRGLQLFDEGDNAGALAEFKQVYTTMPNAVVLYNIGLVYAAMGRPVEAVDALKQVATSESLSPAQKERAQSTLSDQQARIGKLNVITVPAGARISIDGVDVATSPLSAPLQVAAGTRVVGAVAQGYALARREVVVAGNAEATVTLELVRAEAQRDGNLTVSSRISGADVLVDGKVVGKTPLPTSLAVPPGEHTLELRRPGYVTAKQQITLTEGATGDVRLDLSIDMAKLSTEGVLLALDVGQKGPELFVDQQHIGPYTDPVRLPLGPHRVRIEAAGFLPLERDITLERDKTNVLSGRLEPTAETRAAHDASVSTHRLWGWIGIGSGVLIAGGGVAMLVVNSGAKSDAQAELDEANAARESRNTGPYCNLTGASGSKPNTATQCDNYVADKQSNYDSVKQRDIIGYVGIGVGAAVSVTGLVVLLTGPSANEYGALPGKRVAQRRWSLGSGPGDVGASLSGSF